MIANRMTDKSLDYGGKYVSVHLRFEEVVFSVIFEHLLTSTELDHINWPLNAGHGGLLMLCVRR